jgi:hydroxypyruvate isomerase
MERRSFLKRSAAATGAIVTGGMAHASEASAKVPLADKHQFKLKYAPHFGMFRHSAGEDLLDQLQFMADAGFTAMEDNGMKGRELTMQEKIASKMANLGMEMGVFVAHTIYWSEPSLTSGKLDKLDQFLSEIKESVEVAKRVNARWMTVVPGFVDLRKGLPGRQCGECPKTCM